MSQPTPGALAGSALLRLRLSLRRANPLTLAAAVLLIAVAAGLAWTMAQVHGLDAAREGWKRQALRATAASAQAGGAPAKSVAVPPPAPDNLAQFYASLGQRRHAEEQVRTLFALAARNGLTLAQGEYKTGYDRNAHLYTYQVSLPVKGGYGAIWGFAMDALRAIPFASLDDIGFRRDTIGDPQVEARLRLTLYLTEDLADDVAAGQAGRGAGAVR